MTEVFTRGDMRKDPHLSVGFAKQQPALVEKQIGEIGQGALIGGYEALKGEKSDFCFKVSLNNCKYVRVSREELLNVMRTSRYFSTIVTQECFKFFQKLNQIKAIAFRRWVDIRKVKDSAESVADLDPAVYASMSRMDSIRVGDRAMKVEEIIRKKQEIIEKRKQAKETFLKNTYFQSSLVNKGRQKQQTHRNHQHSHNFRVSKEGAESSRPRTAISRDKAEASVEVRRKSPVFTKQKTLSKVDGSTAFNTNEELSTNLKSEHWRLDGYLKKTVKLLQQAQNQDQLFETEEKASVKDTKERLLSAMSSDPKLLRFTSRGSHAALRSGLAFTSSGNRELHASKGRIFKVTNMRLQSSDCNMNKTDQSTPTLDPRNEVKQIQFSNTVHFPGEELKQMITDYRFVTEGSEQQRPHTSRFRDNNRAELTHNHRALSAARIVVNPRLK